MGTWINELLGKKRQTTGKSVLDWQKPLVDTRDFECVVSEDIRKGGILITARGEIYKISNNPYSKVFLEIGRKTIPFASRNETVMSMDNSFWNDNENKIREKLEYAYGTKLKQIDEWKKLVDKNKFLQLIEKLRDQLEIPKKRITERLRQNTNGYAGYVLNPLLYIVAICGSSISDRVREKITERIRNEAQWEETIIEVAPVQQELDPRKQKILEKIKVFEQDTSPQYRDDEGAGIESVVSEEIPPLRPPSIAGISARPYKRHGLQSRVRQRISDKISEFEDTESMLETIPEETDDILAAGPIFKKNLLNEIIDKNHILILNGGALTRVWKLVPNGSGKIKVKFKNDVYTLDGLCYADWLADRYNDHLQVHLKKHFDTVYAALSRKKDSYITTWNHLEEIVCDEFDPGRNFIRFGHESLGSEKHRIYKYIRPTIQNILGKLYPFPQRPADRNKPDHNFKVIGEGPGPVPICTTLTYDYEAKRIKKTLPYVGKPITEMRYPIEFAGSSKQMICIPGLKAEWRENPYLDETMPARDVRFYIHGAVTAFVGWDGMTQRAVLPLSRFEHVDENRAEMLDREGKYFWERDRVYSPKSKFVHFTL